MKRGKREVKRAYGLGRRFLAMFLAMVMCTSMLQLTAFAAQFEDQTMEGYYTVAADGTVATTEDTYVEEDGFKLWKTITQTGKDAFNITLTVQTSQTVTTNEAAIQLVIDTSTSMNYCSNCSSSSSSNKNCSAHNVSNRMTEVKKVLTMDGGFLDSLVEANTGAINVSVVTYGLGAKTVTLDKADADQWIDIKDPAALAKVKSAINGLDTTDNATNMQAGLMLARNRLGMDAVKNAAVKYTVLLTDGYANTYTRSDDKNSTTSIANGSSPSSANGTDAGKSNATNMAAQVKATDTLLYAVGYGTDKPYLTDIIGDATKVFVGSDSASVAGAFKDIAEAAVSGMTGAGTSVTDPMGTDGGKFTMGQFIVLGNVSGLSDKGVTTSGGTLTWELDPAKAEKEKVGDTTTYTYSITYPITLNTAAEGFVEGKYYPTNGYTYLSVPQADGSTKPIAFLVPGVCGEIPEVNWTVEYYLQDDAALGDYANYTHVEKFDEEFGPVDIWTSVTVPDYEGDVYKSKFDTEKYEYHTFESGNVVMQVAPITEDHPENVMRVYYKRTMADVTVNHFYKTDVWSAEGEFTKGTYPADPQTSVEASWPVCEEYTAEYLYSLSGADYELDNKKSDDPEIVVKKGDNTINLYYTREVDNRKEVSAEVRHQYITYGYVIDEDTGRYELVETGNSTKIAEEGSELRATTRFGVNPAIRVSPFDATYELNPNKGDYATLTNEDGQLSFTLVDDTSNPDANVRTLVFEKVVDNRQAIQIAVDHHYTKYVTFVDENGDVKEKTNTYNEPGEKETWYVGEIFQAEEAPTYGDKLYVAAEDNYTSAFELTAADNNRVIDLYYTRTELPNATTILVKHNFRTITKTLVEETKTITNEDGTTTTEVIGTKEVTDITEDFVQQDDPISLYVGQKHTVAPDGEEGYTFNNSYSLSENDLTNWTVTAAPDQLVINLYYDKTESVDGRQEASIVVEHRYTTYLTSVVDGEVVTNAPHYDGNDVVPYQDLKAGDEFEVEIVTAYGDNDDYDLVGGEPSDIILQIGDNGRIVLNYERYETQLTRATYTVNYQYNVYQMVINGSGEPEYVLDTAKSQTDSFTPAADEVFYVGQDVDVETRSMDGFTPSDVPETVVKRLEAESNTFNFVYEKWNDLPQNTVTVNHYYKTTTIAENGTSSVSTDEVLGSPVTKYVGQTVTAVANPGDFTLVRSELVYGEVAAAEEAPQSTYDVVVTDQPAVVNFYYELTDDNSVPVKFEIYHEYYLYDYNDAENPIQVLKEEPITGSDFLGNPLTATPTPNGYTLVSATYNGDTLDAPYTVNLQRDKNVIVFRYEQTLPRDKVDVTVIHNYYMDEDSVGGTPENQYPQVISGIDEDTEYTAEEYVLEDAAYTYTWHSADPADKTITVDDEGENIIIMNYVRATAEYKVIHIYNRNGVEEDRVTETLGGLDGDVVLADSIERVPVHDGKTYTFESISGDLVLNDEEKQVIVLDSDEKQTVILVYNRKVSSGGGGGGGTIIIPEPPVPLDPQPEPEVEIPEEDVPLVEIPEEEVPLVDVPKTGDASALWMLMSVLSGTGLAGVTFLGRKKKEEE